MKTELTTPKAILIGMSLIAVAIASIPYSKSVVGDAYAKKDEVIKIALCDQYGGACIFDLNNTIDRIPLDIYESKKR
jgi:hypothetical protein